MTLTLKKLTLPKFLSKTVLAVGVGTLVIAGIVGTGIVQNVKAEKAQAAVVSAERNKQLATQKELVSLQKTNKELQNALTFQSAKASNVCDWIKTQAAARKVVTPPLCVKP